MDIADNTCGSHCLIDHAKSSAFPIAAAAVIVADAVGSATEVASLTLLDRLVVSLSRAGLNRIIVAGNGRPKLARSTAMGIRVEYVDDLPSLAGPVLVASASVLVTPRDLRQTLENHGRLVAGNGERLPLGIVDQLSADWQTHLDNIPDIRAKDLAALVTPDSVKSVEEAYWASLTSSSDGWVDRHFNRPIGRLLSKKLVATSITPNRVSVVATLVGLAAAVLFAAGTTATAIAGAIVLQLSAVLDCIDGDLARALYKQSPVGKWLDIVGDQVVHIAVFLGIGVGLWRSGSTAPVLVLGSVAATGVILSFLVVLRALLKPSVRGDGRLRRLIDAATTAISLCS
jgi:phosphatidylglycerophosphate synthase